MRNHVVIIGAGMMGSGIAAVSALAGNQTTLVDVSAEQAANGVNKAIQHIEELYRNDLADAAEKDAAVHNLHMSTSLEEACGKAFIVIEAIVEKLPAKQKLFADLDNILPPEVAILSNTSGLRITEIAALVKHPERTVTAHFWFPAHLVPLVEVVMGDSTSLETAESVKTLLASWGKEPVIVRKDLPGQLANRILQAVIREATNIVEMGLATAEDVDKAVKMGMGIRFPVWGPLEHIDAVGLDLGLSVQTTVLPQLYNEPKPVDSLMNMVEAGQLGFKTGKGYYDWSVKDMGQLAQNRNDFIIYALKKIRSRKK